MANNTTTDGTVSFAVRDKRLNSLLDILYPIGSVKITVTDTAPFSEYGFGTWEEVSKGRVLWGADDSHAAGSTIEAGLPNITGEMYDYKNPRAALVYTTGFSGARYSGALTEGNTDTSEHYTYGNSGSGKSIAFNASLSNPIYGNSTTVTPPSYVVHFWQRTA